jgi:asparagine synthase (glutamine-hydrolysing)
MGAIVAIVGQPEDPELPLRLQRMLDRSPYRGAPESTVENGFAVGIQTLGDDASLARTETHVVAFHGFIGNWNDIETARGVALRHCTTHAERIATCYEKLGNPLFPVLRGEFSVAILDRMRRELIVARDVIGLRPLFHQAAAGRLYIATEVRQVLAGSQVDPEIDDEVLVVRLVEQRQPVDRTAYHGIGRFIPAAEQRVRPAGDPTPGEPQHYWQPPPEPPFKRENRSALAEELTELLVQATRRTLPDPPERYGLALSGGVDSSGIWGLIHHDLARAGLDPHRCQAYSVIHPGEPHDESERISLNLSSVGREGRLLDGTGLPVTHGWDTVPTPLNGVYRAGAYHHTLLHDAQQADGIRVHLNGIGGDEWFRGDHGYVADLLLHLHPIAAFAELVGAFRFGRTPGDVWRMLLRPTAARIARTVLRRDRKPAPIWLHPNWAHRYPAAMGSKLGGLMITRTRALHERSIAFHQCGFTRDTTEHAGASRQIEYRHPFFDLDLMWFAFNRNARSLIHNSQTKHLLRRATRHAVPEAVNQCRQKSVFDAAHNAEGLRIAESTDVLRWTLVKRDILSCDDVDRIVHRARMGQADAQSRLSTLYDHETFARQVI